MTGRWEDLTARARGLATHLLGRAQLDALAHAPDLAALGEAFRALGLLVPEFEAVSPELLELAARRDAAAHLRTLARWAGARGAALAVVYDDEDRRSLRAILRGVVRGAPPEERLAGLIPTPTLPARALAELARQPAPGALAALLTAWGNPYGAALLPAATATEPDLLQLEYLLNRTFGARALRGAGRSRELVEFVRETIDLENAGTALILAGGERDVVPRQAFLGGGRRLPVAAFLDAVAAGEPGEAGRRLAAAFGPGPLAAALERHTGDAAGLDEAILRARIGALARRARLAPVGPAAVLLYALRLRAQVVDLRRAIWGVALGAPRDEIAHILVPGRA